MSNDNETNFYSSKKGHSWIEKNAPGNLGSNEPTRAANDKNDQVAPGAAEPQKVVLRRITPESLAERIKNKTPAINPDMMPVGKTDVVDDAIVQPNNLDAAVDVQAKGEFLLEYYPPMAEIVRQSGSVSSSAPIAFVLDVQQETTSENIPQAQTVDQKFRQVDIAASAIRMAVSYTHLTLPTIYSV